MLTKIANRHHSKIPNVGEIGYIINGICRFRGPMYWKGKKQKWQCVYYPLNDNVSPYSIGIHTAYFKNLTTGEVKRFSGIFFQETEADIPGNSFRAIKNLVHG